MKRTVEQLTAQLRNGGVNPDGYGERIGETPTEHVARMLEQLEALHGTVQAACGRIAARALHGEGASEGFDPLDFLPVQEFGREEIDI